MYKERADDPSGMSDLHDGKKKINGDYCEASLEKKWKKSTLEACIEHE